MGVVVHHVLGEYVKNETKVMLNMSSSLFLMGPASDLRTNYLPKYNYKHPSVYTFIELLVYKKKQIITLSGRFMYET